MKKLYTLIILLGCLITLHAQDKTWIGPVDGYWSNVDNWSPIGVPTSSSNVLIPSGSVVNMDNALMDTLTVESGATVNKLVDNQAVMYYGIFQSGSVLNMYEGTMYCVYGLLIDGTVNGLGPLTKGFRAGLIEVNNSMTIEAGSGPFTLLSSTLRINPSGVLNLPGDGILDIAAEIGTLENQGLIQKTGVTGDFIIDVIFNNNGGTINISSGNLMVPNSALLTDGVFNVTNGSSIISSGGSTLAGTLTGLLDGPLVFLSTIQNSSDEAVTYNFTGAAQVEWAGGTLHIGDFVNEGLLTITDTASAAHGINISTLLNNGVINMRDNCRLTMSNTGTLHNSPSGTINLLDSIQFYGLGSGDILNEGTIVKAASSKNAIIALPFTNDGGAISVLGDTLFLKNSSEPFTDGQYDVMAGAAFSIYDGPDFFGTMIGQLDGPMELRSGNFAFGETDTTVFNFTGAAQVNWYNGSFAGGNLKNLSTINAKSTAVYANQVVSGHNLINEGLININGAHGIYMSSGTLLNTTTGVIDIQADNLIQCGDAVYNLGLFKKSGGSGVSAINGVFFHDNPGLVYVEVGTLDFSNIQAGNGDFAGAGTLDLGSNYVVEGDVSPGNSPGTLTIVGTFKSSPTAMFNIELNGTNAGTDFDVLALENGAELRGGINVTMGFPPALNQEFVIITAASVDSCLLPSSVTAVFEGTTYTYDVICNADNVTLGVASANGIDDLISEDLIAVYPNPMSDRTRIDLREATLGSQNARLELVNRLGQTLRSIQIPQGANSIEIERDELPAGLYHLQLIDEEQLRASFRLLVE